MLKEIINKSKLLVDNVKTIKAKINEKLKGIGGKEINNYSELPASLQNAVKNNLKTMAVVSINSKVGSTGGGIDYKELTYTRHINFTPSRVFVRYKIIYTPIRGGGDWSNRDDNKILYIDSAYHNSQDMGGYISVNKIYVKSFTKDKIVLGYRIHDDYYGNRELQIIDAIYIK